MLLHWHKSVSLTATLFWNLVPPWCGHCQAAQAALQEVLREYSTLRHIKVYDGKGKPLGRAFRVKLWPTFILLHKGQEVARLVRPLLVDELRQLLAQSG